MRTGMIWSVAIMAFLGGLLLIVAVVMSVPGEEISADNPRLITWSMSALPEIQYKEVVASGVADGFEVWERLNPELDFERVSSGSDIEIEWEVKAAPSHIGLASSAYMYEGVITIYLGDYDCNGEYNQYDREVVKSTTMHEIGHILGLGHIADEEHLMYGLDGQVNFDTLDYNIPSEPVPYDYFVGEKALQDKIDKLDVELIPLDMRLEELDKEYTAIIESRGMTVEDYESGRTSIRSSNFERTITPVVDEYNRTSNEYNSIIDEYNVLVDAVNCFHPDQTDMTHQFVPFETTPP